MPWTNYVAQWSLQSKVKGWLTCTAFARETGVHVSTSRSLNLTTGSLCLSLCHDKRKVERMCSSKRGYNALTGDDKSCRVCLGKCTIKRPWLDNRKGCSYIRSFKDKKLPNDPYCLDVSPAAANGVCRCLFRVGIHSYCYRSMRWVFFSFSFDDWKVIYFK